MPLKTIGTFSISALQVLDEKGNLDAKLAPKLSREELLKLYRAMVFAREADSRMLKLQRQGRLGTIPVCAGQEAIACGATLAMKETDWFVGSYRELGGRLMRGEPLENTLMYYNGFEEGSIIPANDRTLPVNIILGSQIPHATGLAYAGLLLGEKDTAAVAFFGDGSTSEGDFHEGINFAGVWQAPVVFICSNNQWAISTPRSKQTRSESIAQKAIAYGIEGIQVDGNDVLAVYKAVKEALQRARAGKGPTLIEAMTYRMGVHTTADDPTRYRKKEEVEGWKKKDPLIRFEKYLTGKKLWNSKKQEALLAEIKLEIDTAIKKFEEMPELKPDAPFDYAYGTTIDDLENQRAEFLENLRKDGENA